MFRPSSPTNTHPGILIILAVIALYILLFPFLYQNYLASSAAALVVIPVAVVGWIWGLRAGLVAGLLSLPLNTILLNLVGFEPGGWDVILQAGGMPGMAAVLLIGVGSGWLRDLYHNLQLELQERIRAEEAVRQSEEKLRLIFEYASDGISIYEELPHKSRRLVDCNDRYAEMAGRSKAELLAIGNTTPLQRKLSPEMSGEEALRVRQEKISYTGLISWLRPDGKENIIEYAAVPVQFGDKSLTIGLDRDITERVRMENALRESEARTKAWLEAVPDMMFRLGRDGVILDYKAEPEALYHQGGNLIGQNKEDIYPPDFADLIQHHIDLTLKSGRMQTFEYRLPVPGRGMGDYEARMVVSGQDEVLTIVRDMTAEKKAAAEREQLLHTEREQRLLNETLREVTLTLAAQTSLPSVLDEILKQVRRLVSYDAANITLLEGDALRTARHQGYEAFDSADLMTDLVQPLDRFPLDARAIRNQASLIISDTQLEMDWVYLYKTAWVRSHIIVPLAHQGRILGLLRLDSRMPAAFSERDSERLNPLAAAAAIAIENARLYEQTRRDARTKSILLDEVNHRVKNNLTTIIGLLYIQQEQLARYTDDACHEMIDSMVAHIQNLATAHRLLSESEWGPVLLNDLATQVIYSALSAMPPDKEATVAACQSDVSISPKQANTLALVIGELTTNAIKYALTRRKAMRLALKINRQADRIVFEFQDDGPGYPRHILQQLPDQGGLHLVKAMIRHDLGGQVAFDNNGGARARIRFKPRVSP